MKIDESAALLSPLEQARKVLAVTLEMADDAISRENVFGEQVVTVRWMRSALKPILADLDAALADCLEAAAWDEGAKYALRAVSGVESGMEYVGPANPYRADRSPEQP